MHELYELKDMLCKELEEYGRKGDLSAGSLEIVDKLAHALKNVDKIIETKEEDGEYSGAMPDGMRRDRMIPTGSYRRGSYARGDGRGRGSRARRDAMGRYSSDGYSRAEGDMAEIVEELRGMMHDLPEEKQREVQRFVDKVERM